MADNEILKKTLRHYIDLEYYANGVVEDLDELLADLYKMCDDAILKTNYLKTKADYNAVHLALEEYLSDFQTSINNRLEKEAEIVKETERTFLSSLYGSALTIGAIATSKILFAPFDGRDTVKTFSERSVKNIKRTYDTVLRSGYLFGQKSSDVKEQAEKNLKQVTQGINSGITTAIPSFAKTTDRIVFLNNNVEVVWVATLDGRTCIKCASLSGLHFKSISVAPSLPQHCLCRCQLLPVNSITEPIPIYQEFIESLDEDEQKSILGANRFEMWKKYGISLEKFINNGTVISVNELKQYIDTLKTEAEILAQNEKTAKLVLKNFPNDTFIKRKITDNSSLYVAKNRIKDGIKDITVYNSDKMMAETLVKETGLDFYMLSERGVGVKNPDGFFIDTTMEMKHVQGSLDKLGKNAIRALRQSENVFLYADRQFSEKDCVDKIRGSLNAKRGTAKRDGVKFIEPNKNALLYIFSDGKLYKLHWEDVL